MVKNGCVVELELPATFRIHSLASRPMEASRRGGEGVTEATLVALLSVVGVERHPVAPGRQQRQNAARPESCQNLANEIRLTLTSGRSFASAATDIIFYEYL